jgi:hypothetical protein
MMLTEPEPQVLLVTYILMAARDGVDLLRLRPRDVPWYEMFGRYQGVELEWIGPSNEAAQQFPAILAGFSQPERFWGPIARWGRRRVGGSESGMFLFPIGPGSVVVEFRVRWVHSVVAELEIAIPLVTQALTAAAHQELQRYVRPEL